jgi:hypothetical protein
MVSRIYAPNWYRGEIQISEIEGTSSDQGFVGAAA